MRSLRKALFALGGRGMMNVPAERSVTLKSPGNETAPLRPVTLSSPFPHILQEECERPMSSKANNPSTPEAQHCDQDADAFTYLVGFFGLFAFAIFLFLLLFSRAFSLVTLGPLYIPGIAVIALAATVALPFMRRYQAFFGSERGLTITKAVGMACTCIAPIGLLAEPLFIPAALVMAFGVMALGFLWSLYMCRFSHSALAKLLSFATILAAVISGTLLCNEPPPSDYFRHGGPWGCVLAFRAQHQGPYPA